MPIFIGFDLAWTPHECLYYLSRDRGMQVSRCLLLEKPQLVITLTLVDLRVELEHDVDLNWSSILGSSLQFFSFVLIKPCRKAIVAFNRNSFISDGDKSIRCRLSGAAPVLLEVAWSIHSMQRWSLLQAGSTAPWPGGQVLAVMHVGYTKDVMVEVTLGTRGSILSQHLMQFLNVGYSNSIRVQGAKLQLDYHGAVTYAKLGLDKCTLLNSAFIPSETNVPDGMASSPFSGRSTSVPYYSGHPRRSWHGLGTW
ncbi:hypothetical protein Tco_0424682 [Tanacetum coccineum]